MSNQQTSELASQRQRALAATSCSASFGKTHCLNADCMEVMSKLADGAYDLAICDPPYGIGFSDYERGSSGEAVRKRYTKTEKKQWDAMPPSGEYFAELRRVSKNQIIFGANHFWAGNLPNTPHFIFWNKAQPVKNFAAGELAWTSYDRNLEMVTLQHHGFLTADEASSIHPTQKPVPLYEWTLRTYAEAGWKLLDTHMGSGSSVIAAIRYGCTIIACEIDPDYFRDAVERIPNELAQGVLLPPNDELTHRASKI